YRTSALPLPRQLHHVVQELLALLERRRERRRYKYLLVRHLVKVDGVNERLQGGEGRVQSIGRLILSVRVHNGLLGDGDADRTQESVHSANSDR
ncbi:hypothetical protein PFISCL1PPCAC_9522, partial [Pristionchus fissidentatus]